jgi:hypothetical protein
MTPAL